MESPRPKSPRPKSSNTCIAILKSGKRSGKQCGCKAKFGLYCGRHNKSNKSKVVETKPEIVNIEEEYKWIQLPEGKSRIDIYEIITDSIKVSKMIFTEQFYIGYNLFVFGIALLIIFYQLIKLTKRVKKLENE